jgi:hypothetical protein
MKKMSKFWTVLLIGGLFLGMRVARRTTSMTSARNCRNMAPD